jgi:hypothetical protein
MAASRQKQTFARPSETFPLFIFLTNHHSVKFGLVGGRECPSLYDHDALEFGATAAPGAPNRAESRFADARRANRDAAPVGPPKNFLTAASLVSRLGKPEVSQIALCRIDNFVYWNCPVKSDTDLHPVVPNDMRVVNKTIPDVDQVESGRDILVADNNASARVGDIADAAIEAMCSIGKGNDAAQQDTISPLGSPLDGRRHGTGGLGHVALLGGVVIRACANCKFPTGIGLNAQSSFWKLDHRQASRNTPLSYWP